VFGLATRRAARVDVVGVDSMAVGELAAARLLDAGASDILAEFDAPSIEPAPRLEVRA
jgi:hypothetical protein